MEEQVAHGSPTNDDGMRDASACLM